MDVHEGHYLNLLAKCNHRICDVPVFDNSPLVLTLGKRLFEEGFVLVPSKEGKVIRVVKEPLGNGFYSEITTASSEHIHLDVYNRGEVNNYKLFFRNEPSLLPTYTSLAEVPYDKYLSLRRG